MQVSNQSVGALGLLAGVLLASAGCSVNPATGQNQLSLISEQEEIRIGRQEAQKVAQSMPLYPDEEVQSYIQEVGSRLAATSERPGLDWQFKVVDDPTVNAFALPGGYIFVTRGILTHFNSEAEMASVMGHEIGHVTARHSVEQMSRSQLAGIGLAVAMVASPEFRPFGDLAGQGLGLMFLKFGRDDERQSDDLGLRYMLKAGYDPSEMPQVFEMLDRKSDAAGSSVPAWTSTHPDPGNRASRIHHQIAKLPGDQRQGQVGEATYLERIDGMPFGDNPREGYTIDNVFYHPDLAFRMDFPSGWRVANLPRSVGGMSPQQDALVVLTLSQQESTQAAAQEFFKETGAERGRSWRSGFHHFRTQASSSGQQSYRGIVGFVEHGGGVYQLLGYTRSENWSRNEQTVQRSMGSFRRLTDRRYLDVDERRLEIVELTRSMNLAEFAQRYPSTVDLQTLAIINGIAGDEVLDPGRRLKRVVGGRLPDS